MSIIDFHNKQFTLDDLVITLIKDFFKQNKIAYKDYGNYNNWISHYFNFRLKFIENRKREAKISKELLAKVTEHPARQAYFEIASRASQGMDLNVYQGKGSFNSSCYDGLFNDWGIHHLHLKLAKEKKSLTDYFVSRSDYLVFVMFKNDTAYFIDIYKHNDENIWSKMNLLNIILTNWEKLLKAYELGPGPWNPILTEQEYYTVRNKGYSGLPVNINGKAYMGPGHGYTSSGINGQAVHMSGEVNRWIGRNKYLFETNSDLFRKGLLHQLHLGNYSNLNNYFQ